MKRIILLLAISASFLFQGCTTKEEINDSNSENLEQLDDKTGEGA